MADEQAESIDSWLSKKQQKTAIIVTVLYLELFWLPLLIYKFRQLWQHRHTNQFRKRHPMYLFLLYATVTFHIGIEQPLCLLILYPFPSAGSPKFFEESNYAYTAFTGGMVHIFGFSVISIFFLLFLARSWILYHDYRFNDSSANLCWRLELHPQYKSDNWWISRRSVYGNPVWILITMGIVWLLSAGIYIFIYFVFGRDNHTALNNEVNHVMEWLMAVIALVPALIWYFVVIRKIQKITDVFQIRDELIYTNRICLACLTFMFVMLVICATTQHSFDAAPMVCLESIATCTAGGLIIVINLKFIQQSASANNGGDAEDSVTRSVLKEYNIHEMTLEDILEDRTGFESFIKHMVQEFSVENLLFLVEVQQFQSTLRYQPSKDTEPPMAVPELRLKWLPLSEGLKCKSPNVRAQYIYSKFICKTALIQINISARTWAHCTDFFPELSSLNDTKNADRNNATGVYNPYSRQSDRYSINSENYNQVHVPTETENQHEKPDELSKNEKRSVTRVISAKYLNVNNDALQSGKTSKHLKANTVTMGSAVELLKTTTKSASSSRSRSEYGGNDSSSSPDDIDRELESTVSNPSVGTPSATKTISLSLKSLIIKNDANDDDTAEDRELQRKLYHVFDESEREIWLLMKDSLTRYQQTSDYEKMALGKALRKRIRNVQNSATGHHQYNSTMSSLWKKIMSPNSQSQKSDNSFFDAKPKKSDETDLEEPLLN